MTQQLDVLQLALQALRYHTEQTRPIENTNKVIAIIQEELGFFECNCNQGQVCNVCDPIYPVSAQPDALYTSPPQRQWVGLTDEQIEDITADIHGLPIHVDDYTFARAIEVKLKEKNT